jgi:phage-related protein
MDAGERGWLANLAARSRQCLIAWPVVYYREADWSEPVDEAFDGLPIKVQVAIRSQIERLGPFGPGLGFPYASPIEGELRELRCNFGDDHYRILYRRSRNLFVLLHFLEKRTGKGTRRGDSDRPGSVGQLRSADERTPPPTTACGRP